MEKDLQTRPEINLGTGVLGYCPVCGGDVDCDRHWLGWCDDGELVEFRDRGEDRGQLGRFDPERYEIHNTGVSHRVYRKLKRGR